MACAAAEAYARDGYAVVRALDEAEAARVLASIEAFLATTSERTVTSEAGSLGPQPRRADVLRELHGLTGVLASRAVRELAAAILGGGADGLVLDTCRLMVVEPGQRYAQGFHRDVPPSHVVGGELVRAVLEANAAGRWTHNVLQCTLALAAEANYYCVPGSHARDYTPEERALFGGALEEGGRRSLDGSNAMPPGEMIPGAVCVALRPGELLLQHNLIIRTYVCARHARPAGAESQEY